MKKFKVTKVFSTKYPNNIQLFNIKTNRIELYVDVDEFLNEERYKTYPNYTHIEAQKIKKQLIKENIIPKND